MGLSKRKASTNWKTSSLRTQPTNQTKPNQPTNQQTNMTTPHNMDDIGVDIATATATRAQYRALHNEGQDGYSDDKQIEALAVELIEAQKAASPLATREGIESEREWARSQSWTSKDIASANNACLARGYSLSDLEAAIKSL